MLEAKKIATHAAQNLTKRFAMVVNQCAEAVRILSKRSEEDMLGLGFDGMEKRRSEDMVMLVHETSFVVIIDIDIAIGFFVDIAVIGILAMGVVRQFFDALVDDLIDEFAVVVEEMLNAVVLGSNETFRPINFDGFVSAFEDGLEVVVIDDALVA